MARPKLKQTCTFIAYCDLVDNAFSESQSGFILDALNNSEISFGENNRTMVSLRRMCDIIRKVDDFTENEADEICSRLGKLLKYDEYIDVEN